MDKLKIFKNKYLRLFLLIGLILVLYANTIDHSYTWDDQLVITENQATTKGLSGLKEIWTSAAYIAQRPIYRPIPQSIHAILWELAPNEPKLPHLVNIFFYILCCVLLLRVLHRYFEDSPSSIKYLVVLLFALHPVHTEVVANSKSLDEILAVLFSLLAFNFAFKKSKSSILTMSFFLILACLSKISAITISPFLLFIYLEEQILALLKQLKNKILKLDIVAISSVVLLLIAALLYYFYSYKILAIYLIYLAVVLSFLCKNKNVRSLLFLLFIPALSYFARWEFALLAFSIHYFLSIKNKDHFPKILGLEIAYFLIVSTALDYNSWFISLVICAYFTFLFFYQKNPQLKKYYALIGALVLVLLIIGVISEKTFKYKVFYFLFAFSLFVLYADLNTLKRLILLSLFVPVLELSSFSWQYKAASKLGENEIVEKESVIISENPINPYHNILVAAENQSQKYATIARIQLEYLKQVILPLSLVHQYGTWQIKLATWKDWDVYLSILIHLLLLWLAIYFYRQKFYIAMWGILWYFLTMSIYTNVVRLLPDTLAERFLFMPSIGFSIAFVSGLYFFLQKILKEEHRSKLILAFLLLPLFSYYAYKTIDRNKDWQNNYTLAANTLPFAENNAAINAQYAMELNNLIKYDLIQNQDSAEALVVKHFKKAIAIYPEFYGPNSDLASYYILKAQPDSAFPYLKEAARMMPEDWIHHYYLGLIYYERKKYADAIPEFTALQKNATMQSRPLDFPELLESYEFAGRCLHNLGRDPEAYQVLEEGIAIFQARSTYILLANIYRTTGKGSEAIKVYKRLLSFTPEDQELKNTIEFLEQGLIY
ncbi:MAG: tetratricopeptide repeat protein [Chitinophagales bacterium]